MTAVCGGTRSRHGSGGIWGRWPVAGARSTEVRGLEFVPDPTMWWGRQQWRRLRMWVWWWVGGRMARRMLAHLYDQGVYDGYCQALAERQVGRLVRLNLTDEKPVLH